MDFSDLAQQCAPDVHISTLAAIVRHESGFNPLAIGINSKPHRSIHPSSHQEAVEKVRELLKQKVDFDVGYGQINVRNWKRLGVTPETIFDPCVNLASAQRVLVDCYTRAAALHGSGQSALHAAFSCYNTGNLSDGFRNGYVSKVVAGAGLPVPATSPFAVVAERSAGSRTKVTPPGSKSAHGSSSRKHADAFAQQRNDAFASRRDDVFTKQESAIFGVPVARPDSRPARRP